MSKSLYIVVPCYNEEAVLPSAAQALGEKLCQMVSSGLVSSDSRILFVDDGSRDATWNIISSLCQTRRDVMGIKLAHNCGHQRALCAGMMYAKDRCDCMISIDADLQDDIDVLPQFIEKYNEGCHIVYGVRSERKTDSFFKRATAQGFYRLMARMGAETVYNHADYRLMSRKALDALAQYGENNLFLRGIVPMIGLKTDVVYYSRKERLLGETKYPLKKMINFAADGITSFSVKPLRVIFLLGGFSSFASVCALVCVAILWLMGRTMPGWCIAVSLLWFLGGVQLLAMGILGEYVGKIFAEVKHRPRYYIEEIARGDDEKEME